MTHPASRARLGYPFAMQNVLSFSQLRPRVAKTGRDVIAPVVVASSGTMALRRRGAVTTGSARLRDSKHQRRRDNGKDEAYTISRHSFDP